MEKSGWEKIEILKREELDEYAWHKGFFTYNWDQNVWKRNYDELRTRDISLFQLGNVQGKNILDVGCGRGMYILTLFKMGAASVFGIDILKDYIQDAKDFIGRHGYETSGIQYGDCTDMQFENNSFDLLFSGDVFEHITPEQKDKCIAEAFRVLKPGGYFVIKTPNLKYLKLTLFLQRIKGLLRGKNPFNIHIAHTRDNPTTEHHGLTTHKELRAIFLANCFHEPEITYLKLYRKGFPSLFANLLKRNLFFNDTIIIKAQKPIFLGIYP